MGHTFGVALCHRRHSLDDGATEEIRCNHLRSGLHCGFAVPDVSSYSLKLGDRRLDVLGIAVSSLKLRCPGRRRLAAALAPGTLGIDLSSDPGSPRFTHSLRNELPHSKPRRGNVIRTLAVVVYKDIDRSADQGPGLRHKI